MILWLILGKIISNCRYFVLPAGIIIFVANFPFVDVDGSIFLRQTPGWLTLFAPFCSANKQFAIYKQLYKEVVN